MICAKLLKVVCTGNVFFDSFKNIPELDIKKRSFIFWLFWIDKSNRISFKIVQKYKLSFDYLIYCEIYNFWIKLFDLIRRDKSQEHKYANYFSKTFYVFITYSASAWLNSATTTARNGRNTHKFVQIQKYFFAALMLFFQISDHYPWL